MTTIFSGYKEDFLILNPTYMWPDAGTGTAQAYGGGSWILFGFLFR